MAKIESMKWQSSGACSSDMIYGFFGTKEEIARAYADAEVRFRKTTFALVSARDEKPAYEFLLEKGWKDTAYYTGNSNGEMHLMVLGMEPVLKESSIKKVIRKRVKPPLSRLRRRRPSRF
jgi:hypothetical protein